MDLTTLSSSLVEQGENTADLDAAIEDIHGMGLGSSQESTTPAVESPNSAGKWMGESLDSDPIVFQPSVTRAMGSEQDDVVAVSGAKVLICSSGVSQSAPEVDSPQGAVEDHKQEKHDEIQNTVDSPVDSGMVPSSDGSAPAMVARPSGSTSRSAAGFQSDALDTERPKSGASSLSSDLGTSPDGKIRPRYTFADFVAFKDPKVLGLSKSTSSSPSRSSKSSSGQLLPAADTIPTAKSLSLTTASRPVSRSSPASPGKLLPAADITSTSKQSAFTTSSEPGSPSTSSPSTTRHNLPAADVLRTARASTASTTSSPAAAPSDGADSVLNPNLFTSLVNPWKRKRSASDADEACSPFEKALKQDKSSSSLASSFDAEQPEASSSSHKDKSVKDNTPLTDEQRAIREYYKMEQKIYKAGISKLSIDNLFEFQENLAAQKGTFAMWEQTQQGYNVHLLEWKTNQRDTWVHDNETHPMDAGLTTFRTTHPNPIGMPPTVLVHQRANLVFNKTNFYGGVLVNERKEKHLYFEVQYKAIALHDGLKLKACGISQDVMIAALGEINARRPSVDSDGGTNMGDAPVIATSSLPSARPSNERIKDSIVYMVRIVACPVDPKTTRFSQMLGPPQPRAYTLVASGGWLAPPMAERRAHRDATANRAKYSPYLAMRDVAPRATNIHPATPMGPADESEATPSLPVGSAPEVWLEVADPCLEDVYHLAWKLVSDTRYRGFRRGVGYEIPRDEEGEYLQPLNHMFRDARSRNPFVSPSPAALYHSAHYHLGQK